MAMINTGPFICKECGTEFSRPRRKSGPIPSYCLPCAYERQLDQCRQRYWAHPQQSRDRSREKMRKWRRENPEKDKEWRANYYRENRERLLEYQRQYQAKRKRVAKDSIPQLGGR